MLRCSSEGWHDAVYRCDYGDAIGEDRDCDMLHVAVIVRERSRDWCSMKYSARRHVSVNGKFIKRHDNQPQCRCAVIYAARAHCLCDGRVCAFSQGKTFIIANVIEKASLPTLVLAPNKVPPRCVACLSLTLPPLPHLFTAGLYGLPFGPYGPHSMSSSVTARSV